MKLHLVAGLLFCWTQAFCQVNGQTKGSSLSGVINEGGIPPKSTPKVENAPTAAELSKEIIESDFQYSFVSNRAFDSILKERWEYRFLISFPYIVSFEMNVSTQVVTIVLPAAHTEEELMKLVKRFNFNSYNVTE